MCSLGWGKLKKMEDHEDEFWVADGFNLFQIVEIDEKRKSFYIINQLGKMAWPLKYDKLEEVDNKFHIGQIILLLHEIDKLIQTSRNYITGLLKYLGCGKV